MFEELLRFDKKKKLCFIDFETENLCLFTDFNLPWQLGMLKAEGNEVKEEFAAFLKWDRPLNVGEEAAKITHYDAQIVEAQGKHYSEIVPKIVQWTREADYIMGHNILGFDIYILGYMYEISGYSKHGIAEKMIDTHALAKGIKIKEPYDPKKCSLLEYQYRMINVPVKGIKTRMEVLGPEYGIEHDYTKLHDALVDIRLNFKIWNVIKNQVEI